MFLHPHILWLLVLPLLLFYWQVRGSGGVLRPNKWASAILRLLALCLAILALARPFRNSHDAAPQVVAVIDCSPSMDAAAIGEAASGLRDLADRVGLDSLRLVVFGSNAQEVSLEDGIPDTAGLEKFRSAEAGSAIGDALALAAAMCPDDGRGEIHLFGDGRETRGDMLGAAAALGRRGLSLKIHETGATYPDPALLLGLRAPSSASAGEAITLDASVEASEAMDVKMSVTDEQGNIAAERVASLQAGVQKIPFLIQPDAPGLRRYELSLDGSDQKATASVLVKQTRFGVVESAPDAPAAEALQSLVGAFAEIKPIPSADLANGALDTIDVLVMADTPAAELPVEVQRKLRTWVENGGGLLVTGGRNSLGPGGYASSELAAMLPLRFPQKKEVRDPSTAVAVIIDTSGSMGGEGVSLAKEVARLALKRLKPHDKAGIVEFYGGKRWAAPMQSAANSIAIQRSLNRLSAGGGTVMLPALEEAYYGMLNVRARTKHIIVLTDGGVEEGNFESLLRRMADDGIQVSTVLVGPRAGSSFLAQLAGWGGGQFYSAPSRFQLPEIIAKQPSSSLLDPFVETEAKIQPVLTSRLTRDLALDSAPSLRGYVKTEPKETAELLLRSELGDPVLARWHYGLGRVAILTTTLGGEWAEDFLSWPSAPDLMANLTRQLAGGSPREILSLDTNPTSAGLDLDLRALSPNAALAASPLRVELSDINSVPVAGLDVAPFRANAWSARIENPPVGDCLIKVMDASNGEVLASGGVFVSPPREFTRAAPDRGKLAAASRIAGEFAAKAAVTSIPPRVREIWPICAAFALLSFLLMILARRWPERGIAVS